MSLNVLAGAGQSKRSLLESKGIFEERPTGEVQLLGGIFNRKKSDSGTSTPKNETGGNTKSEKAKEKEK
jgi:hypothetical protein